MRVWTKNILLLYLITKNYQIFADDKLIYRLIRGW